MSDEKLREELERLRTEADNLKADDAAGREHIDKVIAQVEKRLDEEQENDDEGLLEHLQNAIAHFEVEHPRAAAVLNDIMNKLASMGI